MVSHLKKKTSSTRYPAETMTDTDYADDLGLLTNTPTRVESLLYSQHKVLVSM